MDDQRARIIKAIFYSFSGIMDLIPTPLFLLELIFEDFTKIMDYFSFDPPGNENAYESYSIG